MRLEDLRVDLEKGYITYKGTCHDCGAHVEIAVRVVEDGAIRIEGGAVYQVNQGWSGEDELFFKCDECYKEDKTLRYWKGIEVYSRVVGYLRPIRQWNAGKRSEFRQRVEFENTKGK